MNVNLNIFLSVTLLVQKNSNLNSTQNHKDKSISKVRNWSYTTELLLCRHADMFREERECCGLWRSVGRQEMVMVMAIFNHMQYLHHIALILTGLQVVGIEWYFVFVWICYIKRKHFDFSPYCLIYAHCIHYIPIFHITE